MNASNNLLTTILNCGYLDLNYLTGLIEKYEIDFDLDNILEDYWITEIKYLDINPFIYSAFESIKDKFLEECKTEIEGIYTKKYTIYTNCMDSSLWFESEDLQALYEKWQK